MVEYVGSQYALTKRSAGLSLVSCWNEFFGSLNNGVSNSVGIAANNITNFGKYLYFAESFNATAFNNGTITNALAETEMEAQLKARQADFKDQLPEFAAQNAVEEILGTVAEGGVQGGFTDKGVKNYEKSVLLSIGATPYFPENHANTKVDFHGSPTLAESVQKKIDWGKVWDWTKTNALPMMMRLIPLFLKSKRDTCETLLHKHDIQYGKFQTSDGSLAYVLYTGGKILVSTEEKLSSQLGLD
jgi:hypothetical protein